jgi:hypothetical protein
MADAAPEIRPKGPARKPGVVANILAIIGFVILIIIVIWGLLHIINLSTPWFSGMFSSKKEISVSAPSTATASQPFTVSWKYNTSSRGTYAVLYQCVTGLKISVDGNPIPCGAAYTLGNATGSASILPTLTGTTSVQSQISVLFIPSAAGTTGPEATGNTAVKIVKGAPVVTQPTPVEESPAPHEETPVVTKPKPTTSNTGSSSPKPVTPADLSVRVVAVGVIDPYTGAFVSRPAYSPSDVSAVQFDIQNVGGTASGSYTFEANIPTSQPYVFSSQLQPSLGAGAHVINTLRFTPAVDGTFSVTVRAYDNNQSNNTASRWVTGAYNPYPSYPQYPYQY